MKARALHRRVPSLALAALLAVGAGMAPAAGQEPGTLEHVEALIAQGRVQRARDLLEGWWESAERSAPRVERQKGIWLRGILTVDAEMAEADFRRLVVEYPGGPYTDGALLRLGLGAQARGDLREAAAQLETLARDYPSSPLRPRAQAWLAAHAAEIAALGAEAPPRRPPTAQPAGGGRAPRATDPATERTPDRTFDEGRGPVAVQLGAFRALDRARALAEQVRSAGYGCRIVRVPGSDLVRVRVGRFLARDGATGLLAELRERGFEATVVTDAEAEEEIR